MNKKSKAKKSFSEILNQVPADYYSRGIKTNFLQKYWHEKKWKTLENFLKGSKGKLLDIGCADGTTTYYIKNKFPHLKITAVDFYEKAIEYAKKNKPGIEFKLADAHKLPFKNDSFDIVTTIEILEHLHYPQKALREIYRVLKPNGALIVVQDTNSLLFRCIWWLWTKWKGAVWKNTHLNCVNPEKIINQLNKIGFSVKKTEFTNLKMEMFLKAKKIT